MKCRICAFWEKYPYRLNDRLFFEKKCREGTSLRKLELLLESYGIRAKKDLISKHIRVCMNVQVSQQREIEKGIKKEGIKRVGKKLRNFFIRPEEPKLPQACKHVATESFYDISSERIFTRCKICKALLGSADPEEKNNKRKSEAIWRSLNRK